MEKVIAVSKIFSSYQKIYLDLETDNQNNYKFSNVQTLEYLNSKSKDFTDLNSFSIIQKKFEMPLCYRCQNIQTSSNVM